MRPNLRARLTEGSFLWLLLALIGLTHAPASFGLELPALERTASWQLRRAPELSALLAGFTAVMLLALWVVPPTSRRGRLALAGVLLLAGLLGWFFFAPALVFFFVFEARRIAKPYLGGRFQGPRVTPGPNNPRISLAWVLVPAGAALLVAWLAARLHVGERWIAPPGVFLLLLVAFLCVSLGILVRRLGRSLLRR